LVSLSADWCNGKSTGCSEGFGPQQLKVMASVSVLSRFGSSRLLVVGRSSSALLQNRLQSTSGSDDGNEDARKAAKSKLNALLGEFREKNEKKAGSAPIKAKLKGQPRLTRKPVNVKGLKPDIVHAVHRVAHAVAGDPATSDDDDQRQQKIRSTESDLLNKLKSMTLESEEAKQQSEVLDATPSTSSLSSLLQNMKTEEEESPVESRMRKQLTDEQREFLNERRRLREDARQRMSFVERQPVDVLNGQPPLGIFGSDFRPAPAHPDVSLTTWLKCQDRELRVKSTLPPRNLLEDMANMTERGVLWHFPVDNEQGVDQSELEPFYDHVFLEHHLEPWCPAKGPLRHFMELVCVGLSKNPHISAAKKLEHVRWYRDYFEKPEHKDILRASGAYD